MAEINSISCLNASSNTGVGSCFLTPGFMAGAIRVPPSFELTEANLDALQAYLTTQTLLDDPSLRIYPLHDFRGITPNSEDVVTQTLSDGSVVVVRQGNYDYTWQYIDGGMCLHKSLLNWNGLPGYFLFYDKNNVLYGWRVVKADGSIVIKGIPALFNANKWAMNDGANVASFTVRFNIDPIYLNQELGFFKASFNFKNITGLQTVALKQGTTANLAGLLHIKALFGCDRSNFGELYDTELAAVALWIATNAATGNVIDIDTVTWVPGTKDFSVQLDVTDPDYPASATADVNVTLAGPTELNAANISGFESNTVTVKRG